jgi:phage major head subunit gpT-like protein
LQWTEASAREALKHLDGARCFADHGGEGAGSGRSVRDLVGFFSEPALGTRGPEATLTLLESESWARSKLLGAWRAGRMDLVGFSVDAVIGVRPSDAGALRVLEVEEIVKIHSVDMVSAASSGGRALEVLESRDSGLGTRDSGADERTPPESRANSHGTLSSAVGISPAYGNNPRHKRRAVATQALENSGVGTQDGSSGDQKGAGMKQLIERLLMALPEIGDSGLGARDSRDSSAMGESRVVNPDQALREALQAELAASEINPERVLQALADWLGAGIPPEIAQRSALARVARSGDPLDAQVAWDGAPSNGESRVTNPELAKVTEQVRGLRQQIGDAVRRQRIAENRLRLDGKLAASRLPKPLAALVAGRFNPDGPLGGRDITEEEVEMEIQRVREAYAALSPVGKVMETGRVKVVREPEERLQMALDRLFNLPVEDLSIPAFHGIREAYVAYTGDGEVTGLLPSQLRIREDITSTTFPNALANTLRRLLLKEYREQDYGVSLIAQSSSVPDFRAQERVRVGYFGDLPTVDPEAADYAELTAPTDEKASYSVVTFGGVVTITRKMIINDDLGVVPQIVSRLGRSARRTLAQRVFNLMINNPTIYDSVAWFHATHGNLGSTALSAAELNVVRTAMRNRTEKDSSKKLGIAPNVLVVPHELEGTARQENMREYLDSSFTPNPVRFLFGSNGERIVVSPLLSDANDWYVFANVEEAPTVEVGFLQGRQEPEFFLAEDPTSEKVFTSDKIRYKVRHEFEAAVIDFRGAYKEAVA